MSDNTVQGLVGIAQKLEHALALARQSQARQSSSRVSGSAFDLGVNSGVKPEVLKAIRNLAGVASGEEVFKHSIAAAVTVSEANAGAIWLIENNNRVVFRIGANVDAQFLGKSENRSVQEVVGRVLRSQEPEIIARVRSDPSNRAVMCHPLVFGARFGRPELGGILFVQGKKPFSKQARSLMRVVVDLTVAGIETFALHNEVSSTGDTANRYKENLEKLLEVSRRISSTLDIDELLELIVDKALEVSMATRGYVMLRDEKGELAFKVGRAWNRRTDEKRKSMSLKESQFFFSKSITSKAVEERKPICLTDALGDGGANPSVSIVQMELQSVMCAPLLDGDKVLGLVYVDSQAKAKEFGKADLELFEGLAGQAAIALKNAMLYNQVGEKERMKGELDIASKMQADLLPKVVPKVDELEMAGVMEPAKEVGGDYFDFVADQQRGSEVVTIIVGDVSGKGLGAGMVAVMARCHLRTALQAYSGRSPQAILSFLNGVLAEETDSGQFMTMILGWWDAKQSTLRYSSAGHEHIIHWHKATGKADSFVSGGTALGLVSTPRCTPNKEIKLEYGDVILLYTDGVTEAMNEQEEEYSLEMLLEIVNEYADSGPQALVDKVMAELEAFRGKAEQSDDITLVAIRRVKK